MPRQTQAVTQIGQASRVGQNVVLMRFGDCTFYEAEIEIAASSSSVNGGSFGCMARSFGLEFSCISSKPSEGQTASLNDCH